MRTHLWEETRRLRVETRAVQEHEPRNNGEPDVSSRGSARRRRGHVHPVHEGTGRRRGDRPGRRERPGTAHRVLRARAARATRVSGGTRWARPCASAVTRRARPPRCRSAASSTASSRWTRQGEPVRPALLWNDVRSAPQAQRLIDELGGPKVWAERTGSVPGASFTVTKWAWLAEHEPEAAPRHQGRAPAPRLPHRAPHRARARPTAATPPGPAGGRPATESYDEEILAHVGLDPALLPRVVRPGEVGGHRARRPRPAVLQGHPGGPRHRRQRGGRAGPRACAPARR